MARAFITAALVLSVAGIGAADLTFAPSPLLACDSGCD